MQTSIRRCESCLVLQMYNVDMRTLEKYHPVRKFLKGFGKIRRPFAWIILSVGVAGFMATVFNIIATGSAKWATLAGFFLIANDGFSAVQEAEDDADSLASKNNS